MKGYARVFLLTAAGVITACDSPPASAPALPATFEEFRASVPHDPSTGGYTIEGDIVVGEERLRAYYFQVVRPALARQSVAGEIEQSSQPLILLNVGGVDQKWNHTDKLNLTYCVSTATFGANHQRVLNSMKAAALAWQINANVDFRHVPSQDANCTDSNTNVLFDVNEVDMTDAHAKAFAPNEPDRSLRRLKIDVGFVAMAGSALNGVVMHELGHILGFHHESSRQTLSLNPCENWQGPHWRPLSDFDSSSIMSCNVFERGLVSLTRTDGVAAGCLYGYPPGRSPDPMCTGSGALKFEGVAYTSHVQDFGWLPLVQNNDISGTVGLGKRLEAFAMIPVEAANGMQLCYSVRFPGDTVFQPESCNGVMAGTQGQSRAIEAFRIRPVNAPAGCRAVYRAHVAFGGWLPETINNNDPAGNSPGNPVQAMKVRLTPECLGPPL
jgi:serralysin